MTACGRVRETIKSGLTPLVDAQHLSQLSFSTLLLGAGEQFELATEGREVAAVLVYGTCQAKISGGEPHVLGPRPNPFDAPPHALFVGREERMHFEASEQTLIGLGSAPAERKFPNYVIDPSQVKSGRRGDGNWTRDVRFVCWSDNTEGNLLLAGETCTPPGNWSTMPPHRHQFEIPGEEVPYEEVYFFQFTKPQGFGLMWQFDDDGEMDQAWSLRQGDATYMGGGYHPLVSAPGSSLYHLSLMSGPRRMSQASIHKDYRYILEEKDLANQYRPDIR